MMGFFSNKAGENFNLAKIFINIRARLEKYQDSLYGYFHKYNLLWLCKSKFVSSPLRFFAVECSRRHQESANLFRTANVF